MSDGGREIYSEGMGTTDGPGQGGLVDGQTAKGDRETSSGSPLGKEGGFVYFIETEDGQFMKIGYSKDVYRRLSQLGTLRPTAFQPRIVGCIPGSIQTERWLHRKFEKDHDNGEWFRNSPALREFVTALGLISPEPPEAQQPQPPEPPKSPKPRNAAKTKNPVAQALVALRNKKLTPEQRKAIARKAAEKRWGKKKASK